MTDPVVNGRGTAADLLALQRLAWSGLVISATRRCPLSCAHCITRSGPDASEPLLSRELAQTWSDELADLKAQGLSHLTFTGGEPVLAIDAVELLGARAHELDIASYIVTSGAWATQPRVARRTVQRLRTMSHWDIGYDDFHGDHMPVVRVQNLIDELERVGAAYTVRVCLPDVPGRATELVESIAARIGPHGQVMAQSVRAIGRAEAPIRLVRPQRQLPRRPCVSTGLFVRADGSTGPCCSGLAYEARGKHPFDYGSAAQPGGLLQAWSRWHQDPLLRMLRLVGFAAIEGWVDESNPEAMPTHSAEDPCEACVDLWTRLPELGRQLAARAAQPVVSSQLDAVEAFLYGDVWRSTTA